jgi:hypothetical protein
MIGVVLAGCGGAAPAAPGAFTVGTPPGVAATRRPAAGLGAAELPGQPGVVTLARVRAPIGRSRIVTLTGLDRAAGQRQLLCLAETEASANQSRATGTGSSRCLDQAAIAAGSVDVMLTAGWCTPAPVELVVGLEAGAGRVVLTSTAGSARLAQVQLPAGLRASTAAFYGFVRGGSITVTSQPATGGARRTVSLNTQHTSRGCDGHYVGRAP